MDDVCVMFMRSKVMREVLAFVKTPKVTSIPRELKRAEHEQDETLYNGALRLPVL